MKRIILTVALALGLGLLTANAQIDRLAGPRIGFTLLTHGSSADFINNRSSEYNGFDEVWTESQKIAFISQYGWQWESRFADGGDITGVVEWIALVGGMEKGMFLPSASSMVGLRTAKGIEFAVGPNLSLGGIAMVFGAGYNFKFGKLNVPVNIAYVPSMNKTYNHDAEYEWVEEYDGNGYYIGGGEIETSPAYSVTHPTGARISVMVGFNLSK